MNLLTDMSMSGRLRRLAGVALLGMVVAIVVGLFGYHGALMDARMRKTQSLVESAWGVMAHFQELEAKGTLTREQAQLQAKETLRALRYEGKEYFWINDYQPKVVMHPFKPKLEGQDVSSMKDAAGKKLFIAFVDEVRKNKEGFVDYLWPKPGQEEPVPKISYVKGFEPWQWIVGSGIYIDDVSGAFWRGAMMQLPGVLLLMGLFTWVAMKTVRFTTSSLGAEPWQVVEVAEQIASGNLKVAVPEAPAGSVMDSMRKMQLGVTEMVWAIGQSASTLGDAATNLGEIMRDVSDAAQEASNATSATAASVQEMSASIEHISGSARESEGDSLKTTSLAANGETLVGNARTAMEGIASTVQRSTGEIERVAARSREIGGIVNVIKDIAAQTNLLALNAAVEAARAGEQGRGFAVVADEVRNLAVSTTQATGQITKMITTMQSDTDAAVVGMAAANPQVEKGAKLAADTARSLREISAGANNTLQRIRDVAAATREQSETSSHIADNLQHIAEKVDNAAQGMTDANEQVGRIQELSNDLRRAVARFHL
jgi:methyl-accepting chemotaxis protein